MGLGRWGYDFNYARIVVLWLSVNFGCWLPVQVNLFLLQLFTSFLIIVGVNISNIKIFPGQTNHKVNFIMIFINITVSVVFSHNVFVL